MKILTFFVLLFGLIFFAIFWKYIFSFIFMLLAFSFFSEEYDSNCAHEKAIERSNSRKKRVASISLIINNDIKSACKNGNDNIIISSSKHHNLIYNILNEEDNVFEKLCNNIEKLGYKIDLDYKIDTNNKEYVEIFIGWEKCLYDKYKDEPNTLIISAREAYNLLNNTSIERNETPILSKNKKCIRDNEIFEAWLLNEPDDDDEVGDIIWQSYLNLDVDLIEYCKRMGHENILNRFQYQINLDTH